MNSGIFLDASFWIAYRDERQEQHAQAIELLQRAFSERVHFFTTLPVICEIHAHFARSRRRKRAILDDFYSNPVVEIAEVSARDQNNALNLLRTHHDKGYTLCDAISFVVMRRLKVARALVFDEHFRQFGEFEIVR